MGKSTSIQLTDQMIPILQSITSSMNIMLNSFYTIQNAASRGMNITAFETAEQQIDDTDIALQQYNNDLNKTNSEQNKSSTSEKVASSSTDIFMNSGAEQFSTEIQSSNDMMQHQVSSQNNSSVQVGNLQIIPPDMLNDIVVVNNEVQQLASRTQQLDQIPVNLRTDAINNQLKTLKEQFNLVVHPQFDLNDATSGTDVNETNETINRSSSNVDVQEGNIRENCNVQKEFNDSVVQGTGNFIDLLGAVKKIGVAYLGIQVDKGILDLSNELSQTQAQLDSMNYGWDTAVQLQQKIFKSIRRSYGEYILTVKAVSKLGKQIGVVLKSSDEIVVFGESLSKAFLDTGTLVQDVESVMIQLTQSMESGKLQGEEWNAVLDNIQPVVQNLADYLGGPIERMKELATEGEVTAKSLKSALFMTADEDKQFGNMPMTSGKDVKGVQNPFQPISAALNGVENSEGFTNITKSVLEVSQELATNLIPFVQEVINKISEFTSSEGFANIIKSVSNISQELASGLLPIIQNVIEKINEFTSSDTFNLMINGIINTIQILSNCVLGIIDILSQVASFISDNWSTIEPIIQLVVGAVLAYKAALVITKAVVSASTVIQGIYNTVVGIARAAVFAYATGQSILNAVIAACPILWIVLLIIALIAVFYAVIGAINKFAGTSISATGVICGAFAFAGATIWNIMAAAVNFIIDLFVSLWNFLAAIANFLLNVFDDPVGAVVRLFFNLVDTVLGLLQSLASAIDTIFGSHLADSVQGWRDSLSGWVEETFDPQDKIAEKINADDWKLKGKDPIAAYDSGYKFGERVEDSIPSLDELFKEKEEKEEKEEKDKYLPTPPSPPQDTASNIEATANNTKGIKENTDKGMEDLKYLRDIAERETINRFTTAEIKVTMNNNNKINSSLDFDGLVRHMEDTLYETMAVAAEGAR